MKKLKAADRLADLFAEHEVNLLRLEAGNRRAILRSLRRLERDLTIKIQASAGRETFTVTRSKVLLREVNELIRTGYNGIYREHREQLRDLGLYETEATSRIIQRAVNVNLFTVGVPDSVIDSMLKDEVALGVPLKSFWGRQASTLRDNFAREMRAAVFAGETPDQLIRRVRGTKAAQFKDGIMRTSRHGAEVVVRTASQSILNDARMSMYRNNADVLKGVQAQVTLDGRTSEICMARSGFAWDMDGNPIDGSGADEDFPGPPPWHPNCRTTLIPIVKSLGEILDTPSLDRTIDREVRKLPERTQSSMDGQVARSLNYEQWLETKPESFQKEVLGAGKYSLWRKGKISLRDLIDQRGRPLSLAELRRIES